jgi:hypothetical protein
MDFQIIVEALSQSFFECQNRFSRGFSTLCSNTEGFLCMPYKLCWFVSLCGSVTHKKGADRPIVRTEEIVIRNKLRLTFSNP